MGNRVNSAMKRIVLPALVLLALAACSPPGQQASWEHVRDGLHENIYSGDDHI